MTERDGGARSDAGGVVLYQYTLKADQQKRQDLRPLAPRNSPPRIRAPGADML